MALDLTALNLYSSRAMMMMMMMMFAADVLLKEQGQICSWLVKIHRQDSRFASARSKDTVQHVYFEVLQYNFKTV